MTGGAVNLDRLGQLVRKEFRQMLRDPRSRRMLFVAPVRTYSDTVNAWRAYEPSMMSKGASLYVQQWRVWLRV